MRELTEEDTDAGELLDLDEFLGLCIEGNIIDEDGYCHLVYDDMVYDEKELSPTDVLDIDDYDGITEVLLFRI